MTGQAPLEAFCDGLDAADAATVRAVAAVVDAARPDMLAKASYGMWLYCLAGRWKQWVVGIGVVRSGVRVRFLRADLLDAPDGVLRFGSSTLAAWDVPSADGLDAPLLTHLVRQAADNTEGLLARGRYR